MAKNAEATLLLRIKQIGGEALDKVSAGLSAVADMAKYVGGAIIAFAAAGVHAFKEAEEASNALAQSMVQQGIYSTDLKKKYDDWASALQKVSTYGDEQITAAQALIQAQIGQVPLTKELVQATLDLAAAKKMDLSSAADMVGKSIGTETNALARQGIQLDKSATTTEKMSRVTEELNRKFGGQAAAAAEGYGSIEKLKNIMSDIFEVVGSSLQPVFNVFTKQLFDFGTSLQTSADFVRGLNATFDGLAKGAVFVKNVILGLTEVWTSNLATAVESVTAIMDGNWSRIKQIVGQGATNVKDIAVSRWDQMNKEMEQIDTARVVHQQEQAAKELALAQESAANKAKAQQDLEDKNFIATQTKAQERFQYETDLQLAELQSVGTFQDEVIAKKMAFLDKQIADEQDFHKKRELMQQKARLMEKQREELTAKEKQQLQKDTFATIATMSDSNNKVLAGIGKAAALTQIAIDTPVAVSKAMAAFPPPFNFAAAAAVGAAMAAQAAKVTGIKLAEGGIVKARPGGVQATIGEGGQDEAVIPLDKAGSMGLGGGVTVYFNGPVMGDEHQAKEFAKAVDRELLKLRQSNQSVAFETGIF